MFQKNSKLTEAEQKWNLMWDLWAEGKAISPYAQMMEYESEVNNGGHSQYFFNVANCGDLKQDVDILLTALPEPLCGNLKRGYDAFAALDEIDSDENDDLFDECDSVFYDHEQLLIEMLEEYAQTLTL